MHAGALRHERVAVAHSHNHNCIARYLACQLPCLDEKSIVSSADLQ